MAYIRQLLESLSPKHGASDVNLDASISLKFKEMMMLSSLNDSTVFIVPKNDSGAKISASYDYSQTTRTLVITPRDLLEENTEYFIIIKGGSSGVRSMRGDTSIKDTEYPFATGQDTLKDDSLPAEETEENSDIIPNPLPVEKEAKVEDVAPDIYSSSPLNEGGEVTENEPLSTSTDSSFRVVRTYPSADSLWETEEPIAIRFSKPVGTPTSSDFSLIIKPVSDLLETKTTISTALTLSSDKKTVYIQPSGNASAGEEFRLTISEDFASADGEKLSSKYILDLLSHFEFFYLDVETLKLVGGQFVSSYTDMELAKLIGNASVNLYSTLLAIEETMGGEYTIVTGIDSPYGANQYILYSVLYQTILGSSLTTASGQKTSWKLGDLSTEGSTTIASSLPDLLKMLKDEMNRWWEILISKDPLAADENEIYKSWHREATSAVRGETDFPYPDFQTRVPFNRLGGNL